MPRLSSEVYERLHALAEQRGITPSEIVLELLDTSNVPSVPSQVLAATEAVPVHAEVVDEWDVTLGYCHLCEDCRQVIGGRLRARGLTVEGMVREYVWGGVMPFWPHGKACPRASREEIGSTPTRADEVRDDS